MIWCHIVAHLRIGFLVGMRILVMMIAMVVTVPVIRVIVTTATMGVAVWPAMLEYKDAHQVDQEAKNRNDHKTIVLHLGWLQGPFDRFLEDKESHKHQKESIYKAGQNLRSKVARCKQRVR